MVCMKKKNAKGNEERKRKEGAGRRKNQDQIRFIFFFAVVGHWLAGEGLAAKTTATW